MDLNYGLVFVLRKMFICFGMYEDCKDVKLVVIIVGVN